MIHGLEDVCSDDALWMVRFGLRVRERDRRRRALRSRCVPFADEGEATVYEHLKRALDFSAEQVGPTGICKGLRADWNDCLNLGGGESAMVSFLHHWALRAFVEAAEYLGRNEDAEQYRALADKVRAACETRTVGWRVVHARHHRQGREDRLARERRRQDLHREQHLGRGFRRRVAGARPVLPWTPWTGISTLSTASICCGRRSRSRTTISALWAASIKASRKMAAIFSHPNPWAIIAECKLGRGSRAMKFYDALLPSTRTTRSKSAKPSRIPIASS